MFQTPDMEEPKIDPNDGTHIINRTAKIRAETSSFLSKGDKVVIKKFNPTDNLYLAWMGNTGIWIKAGLFEFDEVEKKSAFNF